MLMSAVKAGWASHFQPIAVAGAHQAKFLKGQWPKVLQDALGILTAPREAIPAAPMSSRN